MDDFANLIITRVNSALTMHHTTANKKTGPNCPRPCWAILVKYEGESVYVSNGKTHIANKDTLLLLPKGCHYKCSCTQPGHFSVIDFECDTECKEIFSFPLKDSERILKFFKELERKRILKQNLYEMESIRDTYTILLIATQSIQQKYFPRKKIEKITPAIDYISKNYNKDIKNEELAKLTGLSTVYFRKLFSELMGISPIAYAHKLRIRKAKEMLRSNYSNITHIALSLGYSDLCDFSRDFKRHTGIPPSKY